MIARRRHFMRSHRWGFTLIEVLAATTMFAVLVGAVYSILYSTVRLRERSFETLKQLHPRQYAVDALRGDLAGIVVPEGLLAGAMIGEKQESGSRRADVLEFHAASGRLDALEPWGDIQRIAYSLEQPEAVSLAARSANRDLVRSVTRNLLASTEEEPEMVRVLHNVESLAFEYYDGEDWVESWDSTAAQDAETDIEQPPLPKAIRVTITFALDPNEEDERQMLPIEMVIPVLVETAELPEQTETSGQGGPSQPNSGGGR
jgi:type II secretion system protein J